jgi:hypothetical protein
MPYEDGLMRGMSRRNSSTFVSSAFIPVLHWNPNQYRFGRAVGVSPETKTAGEIISSSVLLVRDSQSLRHPGIL